MLVRTHRLLVCALAVGAAVPSFAAIVNFSVLSQDNVTFNEAAAFNGTNVVYSQDGYDFTLGSGAYGMELGSWGEYSGNHPLGGVDATSLTSYYAGNLLTISQTGGGAFNLYGIDLAPWGVGQTSPSFQVQFVGTMVGGGLVTQDVTVLNEYDSGTGQPILQTETLTGFTDLTSVTFQQDYQRDGNAWQFNNLNVGAVPEPCTLLGLGLGAIGLYLRRRRT